jgi:hypothetical protein
MASLPRLHRSLTLTRTKLMRLSGGGYGQTGASPQLRQLPVSSLKAPYPGVESFNPFICTKRSLFVTEVGLR